MSTVNYSEILVGRNKKDVPNDILNNEFIDTIDEGKHIGYSVVSTEDDLIINAEYVQLAIDIYKEQFKKLTGLDAKVYLLTSSY